MDSIAILDFGSQYAQLIARRVREIQVYSELFPWNAPAEEILALEPKGFILSGGPASIYEAGAPQAPPLLHHQVRRCDRVWSAPLEKIIEFGKDLTLRGGSSSEGGAIIASILCCA